MAPLDRRAPLRRLGRDRPGGRELYDRVLEYLTFAEPALEKASDGEQLKKALVERFPHYEGVILIDLENSLYLFPGATQA